MAVINEIWNDVSLAFGSRCQTTRVPSNMQPNEDSGKILFVLDVALEKSFFVFILFVFDWILAICSLGLQKTRHFVGKYIFIYGEYL